MGVVCWPRPLFSQRGWGGAVSCLLPRPQGMTELALSHALLAHSVLPSEAHATTTHLGGYCEREREREQISYSVHLEGGLSSGEKVTCAPSLESKSLPNRGTGHSRMFGPPLLRLPWALGDLISLSPGSPI